LYQTMHRFYVDKFGVGIAAGDMESAAKYLAGWLKTKEAKGLPASGWQYLDSVPLESEHIGGLCYDSRKGILDYKAV
jgi:hypothetical protein